jgi:hypothetical protein
MWMKAAAAAFFAWRRAAATAAFAGLALAAVPAQADVLRACDAGRPATLAQQSKLLRLADHVRQALNAHGAGVALVARSGTNLSYVGLRYSHAGFALRDSPAAPWAVRQLYFACEEGAPRLFDQGLSAFLLGADDADLGYLSVLLLPTEAARAVEAAALDRARALHLLHPRYSANAHAFNTLYQNCNQWVAELLAQAWGAPNAPQPLQARQQAQAWLQAQGYQPTRVHAGAALMLAAAFVPWVHRDDHPEADLQAGVFAVSMPDSLSTLVQQQVPGTQRLEFCHNARHLLLRRNGPPIADGCEAAAGDKVWPVD